MAEPNISVDYEGLQNAAAIDRGWTTTVADWTAANTLHFAEALKRGCNRFWFPAMVSEVYRRKAGQPLETVDPEKQVDHYEWSFLRKAGSITLATGTSSYTLPDDFGGSVIDESVNFAAGQGKVNLAKIDAGTIASMRSTENATGVPKYYALRPATYDGTASCDWLIEVYPTPTSGENALVVSYDYQFVPSVPTTGQYQLVALITRRRSGRQFWPSWKSSSTKIRTEYMRSSSNRRFRRPSGWTDKSSWQWPGRAMRTRSRISHRCGWASTSLNCNERWAKLCSTGRIRLRGVILSPRRCGV